MKEYQHARRDYLPADIDLEFASKRWKAFVQTRHNGQTVFKRRELEVCKKQRTPSAYRILSYVADALRCGDLHVTGSEEFADYRQQLLPREECQKRLSAYLSALQLPANADDFVACLQRELAQVAHKLDQFFPHNSELTIDENGKPHLKRMKAEPIPDGLDEFKENVQERMPERHLLDILKNVQHWVNYTRHFTPPSGSDPKMTDAVSRYLFTIFGYAPFGHRRLWLTENLHVFEAIAINKEYKESTPAQAFFFVGKQQSKTKIGEPIMSPPYIFKIEGSDVSEYKWRLDGSDWQKITETSLDISKLSDGRHELSDGWHVLEVKAINKDGIEDPTPEIIVLKFELFPDTKIINKPEDGIPSTEEIETSTNVTIGFSGSDSRTPTGKLIYRWCLDDKWYDPSPKTEAYFPELSEGWHVFKVKAIDADGYDDPTPEVLSFKVVPIFPRTFIILSALRKLPLSSWEKVQTKADDEYKSYSAFIVEILRNALKDK